MIRAFTLCACVLLAYPALAENKREAHLVEIKGSVWVKPQGGEWDLVTTDMLELPLEEGEGVKTGPAPSEAVIQIDGVNSFHLGAKTEFELAMTNLSWTKLKLFTGSFFSKIEEKLKGSNRAMHILLPTSVLAVRGTEFSADTEPDGESDGGVGVFEGQVEAEFSSLEGKPSILLGPEEEIDLVRSGPPPRPRALKRFLAVKKRLQILRKRHASLRAKWRSVPLARRKAIMERVRKARRRHQRQKNQP
ncbi:MAG: FecR domain-containing protein [Elusimicrobiota bacterium]